MYEWSFDITKAPRGQMIPQERPRTSGGETKHIIVNEFVPDWLWLATKCGKVLKSHWLPAEGKTRSVGRWSGLSVGEEPVAWQAFVVPSHPGLTDEAKSRRSAALDELGALDGELLDPVTSPIPEDVT